MEVVSFERGYPIPKRKRGRPPKIRYPLPNAIEFPAAHLTEGAATELQLVYKPLKEMMGIMKLKPLVEKPDELLYGLYDYYDVIEKPMWLLEVSRKFAEKEYHSAEEVVRDVRLTMENCYRFWGEGHKFAKQALRVEKIISKHIVEFPDELKSKCLRALFDDDSPLSEINSIEGSTHTFMTEEYTSIVLKNLEKLPSTTQIRDTLEEMQKWEEELLQGKQISREITLTAELAEIGQFLLLTKEILGLKSITQYEIERMLLIAKESTTLATIMTTFLCPTAMRAALYFKPIMVYDVWSSLLHKKLDGWFNTYAKSYNRVQIFLKYGIEPSFFEKLGNVNPLAETSFDQLTLLQKACILKALCSNIFHSNKKAEEFFNLVDEDVLKAKYLFSDSKYDYVSLFSPEIRVYRSSKICLEIGDTIEAVYPGYFNYYPRIGDEEEESFVGRKGPFSKKQKFCLLAHDTESLADLYKVAAKKRKRGKVVKRLLAEENNEAMKLTGLRALYNQWKRAICKEPASVEISRNYWIVKAVSAPLGETTGTDQMKADKSETMAPFELGKRVLKKKYSEENQEESFSSNDEQPNEEYDSDWADGNVRRSRRMKRPGALPRFFHRKFTNLEDGVGRQDSTGQENNRLPGLKKIRARREKIRPHELADVAARRAKKSATNPALRGSLFQFDNVVQGENTQFGWAGVQDEPYLPPAVASKFLPPLAPLDCVTPKQEPPCQPTAAPENDLFDLGGWDFGLQGFPASVPLKPVTLSSEPSEEGETKLLELGAYKTEAPKLNLIGMNINPVRGEVRHKSAPTIRRKSSPHVDLLYPMIQPNMMVVPQRGKGRNPLPGTSRVPNTVFVHSPLQELKPPKLMTGVLPVERNELMILNAELPKIKLAVPHHLPYQQQGRLVSHPPQGVFVKRKVNLPARPLNIPMVGNDHISISDHQAWANCPGARTVLYIPSGTPTITIPSSSDPKDVSSGHRHHSGISEILKLYPPELNLEYALSFHQSPTTVCFLLLLPNVLVDLLLSISVF